MAEILAFEEVLTILQAIIARVFKNLALPLAITKNYLNLSKSLLLELSKCKGNPQNLKANITYNFKNSNMEIVL